MKHVARTCLLLPELALALLAALWPAAAQAPKRAGPNEDFQAAQQLDRALELMKMNEEERGIKLLQSIPQLFPNSKVRFDAMMRLGKHYVEKKQYPLAIKQFTPVLDSGNDVIIAESLYEIGKCNFFLTQYNQSFSFLRRLTADYPNSVFANQAYYYIGMCHFAQKHWKKAIDSLRMVGTAVAQDDDATRYAEGGQRFFVKVHDKDLVVLAKEGETLKVEVSTAKTDKEVVELSVLDKVGEYYIGSIQTTMGKATPGNNVLEITGGDTIACAYVDSNTASGDRLVSRAYKTQVVGTATVAFTDGAFANIVKGLFLGQDAFIRVTDIDRDTSDQKDKLTVSLASRYVQKDEEGQTPTGTVDLTERKVETRDALKLDLVETGEHTGVFTTVFRLKELEPGMTASPEDPILHARQGDTLKLSYTDNLHIDGADEVERTYESTVLGGSMQDVSAQIRLLSDLELQARKNIIEARALKELAEIFRNVGLKDKSNLKAQEGLAKVEDVILNRKLIAGEYVQEALQVKWELFLVMERLTDAIATCRMLLQLFPQSSLVDQAMLKIGQANAEKGQYQQAISIFTSILSLPKSDAQPLAAFSIGEAYEKMAEAGGNKGFLTNAMNAFQSCAEKYPNSLYAGQSLEKVANFYLKMQDYTRAAELMQNVAQDFPDLENMDAMLLKWAIALYRLNRLDEAVEKLNELLNEYPESPHAAKAREYRKAILQKLGRPADGEGGGAAAEGGAAGGAEAAPAAPAKEGAGEGGAKPAKGGEKPAKGGAKPKGG